MILTHKQQFFIVYFVVKTLACGSRFQMNFEHFDGISMVYVDLKKLLSICFLYYNTTLTVFNVHFWRSFLENHGREAEINKRIPLCHFRGLHVYMYTLVHRSSRPISPQRVAPLLSLNSWTTNKNFSYSKTYSLIHLHCNSDKRNVQCIEVL